MEFAIDHDYIDNHKILTTTNIDIKHVNTIIVNHIPLHQHMFLFVDIVTSKDEQDMIYRI